MREGAAEADGGNRIDETMRRVIGVAKIDATVADYKAVHAYLAKAMGSLSPRESAKNQDLIQGSLLKAIKARDSWRGESSLAAWVVSIVRHSALDAIRANSRMSSLDEHTEQPPWMAPDAEPSAPPEPDARDVVLDLNRVRERIAALGETDITEFLHAQIDFLEQVDERSKLRFVCNQLKIDGTEYKRRWSLLTDRARKSIRRDSLRTFQSWRD